MILVVGGGGLICIRGKQVFKISNLSKLTLLCTGT